MNQQQQSPAGWYPNQNGHLQWWDGTQWVETTPLQSPYKTKRTGLVIWVTVSVVILGIFAFALAFASSQATDLNEVSISPNSEVVTPTETTPPAPVKSEAQVRDETMEADGWMIAEHGVSYVRFATDAEMASASCGYWDCTWVYITSFESCGSFYVKADLMNGGSPVGWTNEISASLLPQETLSVMLEDHQGYADSFRLSEVYCMG